MPQTRPLRATDPRELGGYRLTARIGEGAQGIVFLGESDTGERVAAKVLHADVGRDERARTLFDRELAAARRVAPFCTARVLAAEADGDLPYIVSEYIDGPSLRDRIASGGAASPDELVRLAVGTATALAAIHEAGVVHRDFKPANVLLGPDGPKVIDFGVARPLEATSATLTGAVGTPAYMAPEQIEGATGGPPLDMFAWGCTMTFAANGTPPFPGPTVPVIMRQILYAEPELGALTGDLRDLVASCLAKDPATRPTALQVLQRLLGLDADADLLAEGTTAATRPSPPSVPTPRPPDASPPGGSSSGSARAAAAPGDAAPPDAGLSGASPSVPASSGSAAPAATPPASSPSGVSPAGGASPGGSPSGSVWPAAAPSGPSGASPPAASASGGSSFGQAPLPFAPPDGAPVVGVGGSAGPPSLPPRFPAGGPGRGVRPLLMVGVAVVAVVVLAGVLTVAVLLLDGDDAKGKSGTGGGTPVAGSGASGPCRYLPAITEKIEQSGTPPASPPAKGATRADVHTNLGTIVMELDPRQAPCTVNSVAYLAGQKFFDGTRCHRLTTDPALKVLQCGDPSGTGKGGPSYRFGNESLATARYTRGTVAMANAGQEGTNGSQFFVLYKDTQALPPSYTVFGRVTAGMEVVDMVAEDGVVDGGTDGPPRRRLTITQFRTT